MDYLIFLCTTFCIIFIANKKKFLPNYTGDNHQIFLDTKNTPLVGGLLFLIILLKIFNDQNIFYNIIFILIFFVGLFSDTRFMSSPKIRLVLQFLIISYFIVYFDIKVTPTRIEIVDIFLQNNFFSIIFSIFCFMILLNGSNFIDGLNGLLIGYFLIIFLNLEMNNLISIPEFSHIEINFLLFSMIILLVLNYFNFFYLGDSGSYLLALFSGYLLVNIYSSNVVVSPYYIILLLWYPCFELLFSLIRKYIQKKSPTQPDNKHLHHLIFLFFKSKIINKNYLITNVLSSFAINSFNFLIIFLASKNPNLTLLQLKLIFICLIIYCLIYSLLNKKILPFKK